MKKMFIGIITALLLATGTVWADTVGDIDADGKITLTEAMGSLQITSGRRVASYTTDNSYAMSEYRLDQSSGKKIWKQTEFGSGPAKTGIGVISFSKEILNSQEVTSRKYETGMWAEYDFIDYNTEHQYLGESDSGFIYLYDPPVTNRIDPWSPGQKIINMNVVKSDDYSRIEYQEYLLLGEEDVTVPAGTFENCLKILIRRARLGRTYITYLAKGIGSVKSMRADNQGKGYIWELMDIQKEDGVYFFDSNVCQGEGTWVSPLQCPPDTAYCKESGVFTMAYTNAAPYSIIITLKDFQYWNYSMIKLYMLSTDGINFLPDPDAAWPDTNYDNQPDIPDISLKIDNKIVTGTLNSSGEIITLNGTVSCP